MSFPSTKVIFEKLGPLSLKNGLILFQKFIIWNLFNVQIIEIFLLVFRKMFKQRLRWRLKLHQSIWLLSLLNLFFSFDLIIISIQSSLVIKALLLCLSIFFFKGACLFNSFKKTFSNFSTSNFLNDLYIFILGVPLKLPDFGIVETN